MSLQRFVRDLLDAGRIGLDPPAPESSQDAQAAAGAILELDRRARLELAHTVPALVLPVATWALGILRRGCLYLAYREVGAEEVARGLGVPCPGSERQPEVESVAPAVLYSADLGFRWLPDLIRLARGVSDGDPLVEGLRALAAAWPLSSVGVADTAPTELPEALRSNPCLRALYVDRILATGDLARLADPSVADSVRVALGLHPGLCPVVAKALELHRCSPAVLSRGRRM